MKPLTPLQQKIIDVLKAQPNGQISYHEMLRMIWPPEQFPKAWNYSSNGGPPGCAMSFGRAFGKLRRAGLVWQRFSKHGQGDLMVLNDVESARPAVVAKEKCNACGAQNYEGELKECPHCGSTKCSICDMGNDVECPACPEEE